MSREELLDSIKALDTLFISVHGSILGLTSDEDESQTNNKDRIQRCFQNTRCSIGTTSTKGIATRNQSADNLKRAFLEWVSSLSEIKPSKFIPERHL